MGCKYMGYDFRCNNKKVPKKEKIDGYRCKAYIEEIFDDGIKGLDDEVFCLLSCREELSSKLEEKK